MSLYKRGGIWWFDFTIGERRYRESTKLRGKAGAQKVEEAAKQRAILGSSTRKALTLEEAASAWFAAKMAGRKSETTAATRLEILLRHIPPTTMVAEIDAPDVAAAITERRAEPIRQSTQRKGATPRAPSNSTVNRDMIDTTLRPILRYAKRALKQKVHDIDWAELRLEEPKGRVRQFTPVEMDGWADHLPSWHRPIRDFLGRYGVRLTEAFFPLSAINTETWEITVRGPSRKNGRPHVIPLLDDDARDMAARMGRAQAAGLDTVWFREMKSGELRQIRPRGYQSAAKTALRRAGIGDARPAHDLRHHAGTTAMRASGNLKVVQQLLGHESITSTARYAHADSSDVLKALRHAYVTSDTEAEKEYSADNGLTTDRTGT